MGRTAGWQLVPDRPDWPQVPTEVEAAWLEELAEEGEPEEYADPEEEDWDQIAVQCAQAAADQAYAAGLAAAAGTTGALAAAGAQRRGPGQPGSAERIPGEYEGPAALFGTGMMGDIMPGCPELAVFADEAAGPGDAYDKVSGDELVGLLCAWDRLEAHMAARKYAAVAELMRRRVAPGWPVEGDARMPVVCDKFLTEELAQVLAVSRWGADELLGLAWELEVRLPGTKAALRSGVLSVRKAEIIASAVAALDPGEARAAEALVLGRAARLTPAGLRSAIVRAAMEVAPDAARKRREEAAKQARVERRAEDSGNASLAGRELPPAGVLAADQRVSWWARQLREAGLDGSMDQLRATAYLDLLLGTDSRPPADPGGVPADTSQRHASQSDTGQGGGDAEGPGGDGNGPAGPAAGAGVPGAGGSGAGVAGGGPGGGLPAGFAGRVHLTVPLATLLGLADRPGEIPGIGPVDPWLARDLAAVAARNPATTWCMSVTDQHGHAIGHGCARPAPRNHARPRAKPGKPGTPGGPDPPGGEDPAGGPDPPGGHDPPDAPGAPGGTGDKDGPGFAFTASGQHGPPGPGRAGTDAAGGYGTWRLDTGIPGRPKLAITLEPVAVDECDHRYQARGHDPGVRLRHLAEVRHATCTAPGCRRPAVQCDFEHNIPYEAGGRTCMCNGGPKCRRDHQLKQHPQWAVEQVTPGTFRWTTPSGRQYTTEPTRYPI